MQNTLELSWKASTRLVIHFCDAPCHGTPYHDGCLDYFPAGDPAGRRSLLTWIVPQRPHTLHFLLMSAINALEEGL